MPDYSTLITAEGQAAFANAIAIQTPVIITAMAVGDSNGLGYDPDENQIALVNEVYESNDIDVTVEAGGIIAVEMTIPVDQGGWHVREAAVKTDDGTVLAIMRYPDSYKPRPSSSIAATKSITMKLDVGNTNAVSWQIDPASRANIAQQLRPDFRSVEAVANDPVNNATAGQTWIVGDTPTSAWIGHENELAEWTGTAWAFAVPTPWMLVADTARRYWSWNHTLATPAWVRTGTIYQDETYTVGSNSDFATLADAVEWLSDKLIVPTATVTMDLAAETHDADGLVFNAQSMDRVVWRGQNLTAAVPTFSDFNPTGVSGQHLGQSAQKTYLDTVFPTRFSAANSGIKVATALVLENVLIDGANQPGANALQVGVAGDANIRSVAHLKNVHIHNFNGSGLLLVHGSVEISNYLGATFCDANGIYVANSSYLRGLGGLVLVTACDGRGIHITDGSRGDLAGSVVSRGNDVNIRISGNSSANASGADLRGAARRPIENQGARLNLSGCTINNDHPTENASVRTFDAGKTDLSGYVGANISFTPAIDTMDDRGSINWD